MEKKRDIVLMSKLELSRHHVIQQLKDKHFTQREAATLLGLSVRQVKRLLRSFCHHGVTGLISKRRGRPSNNQLAEEIKAQAISLVRAHCYDFGPTLAHEKLVEIHGLKLSVEALRQLMIAHDLWQPHRPQKPVIHQLRQRRACFGELVQIDGSPHDWFEDRGPRSTLLVFIDDATGRLLVLLFVPEETTFAYFEAVSKYLTLYGKPRAFYSDKDSVFRVNKEDALSGTGLTQFGRAMHQLSIEIICANSPQAKGRVERVNQTLQDRLVKELRLRGISNRDEANAFMPEFIASFNRRFAVAPRHETDAHRLLQSIEDLKRILCLQESRVLSKNLTLQYKKVIYQIQTPRPTYTMRQARVTVNEDDHGNVEIIYQGKALDYTIYNRQQPQAEITPAKLIDQKLAAHQPGKKAATYIPPPDHPWRRFNFGANSTPK